MYKQITNLKNIISLSLLLLIAMSTNLSLAQPQHGGGGHHGMWPDSLEVVTLSGKAIVDSTHVMPMYYLDTNDDDQADYHLSFGPYWYEPATGATRPNDGDVITIKGAKWGYEEESPTIMVYEINGLKWREPIEGGMHGWDGDHFWGDSHNEITVSGTALIDSSYYYVHYFLDEDGDGTPEYMLNFGPPWYLMQNASLLPTAGQTITVTGNAHDEMMMTIPSIMVYEINGVQWRNPEGPPPWSGNWMHRDANDTSYTFTPTDSLDWMGHPPGSMMGMMMGGGMFPDSIYCQFEEMYPDYLPGQHDSTLFAGYYMNMYDPAGQTMMNMSGMRRMRFNRPTTFQFHYDDEHLSQMGLSDEQITVKYWNENNSSWVPIYNYTVDSENNIIKFQNEEMYSYYALFGSKTLTGIEDPGNEVAQPEKFTLFQNYPNPFNPETTIKFSIPDQSHVSLIIYNSLGQKVRTLLSQVMPAGIHQVNWNSTDDFSRKVASGIYFLQLKMGNQQQIQKMTLMR